MSADTPEDLAKEHRNARRKNRIMTGSEHARSLRGLDPWGEDDPEDLDWKDFPNDAFAHYTAYGSCGSAPGE